MKTIIILTLLFLFVNVTHSRITKQISGKVVSAETGKPIEKFTVVMDKSVNYSYINRGDGKFSVNLFDEKSTISVISKGFETKKVPVTIDSVNMLIALKEIPIPEKSDEIVAKESDVEYTSGTDSPLMPSYKTEDRTLSKSDTKKTDKTDKKYLKEEDEATIDDIRPARVEGRVKIPGGDLSGLYPDPVKASKKTAADGVSDAYPATMAAPVMMAYTPNQASSGKLTAGEVNDFSKWVMWNDIAENDLAQYKDVWKYYPKDRYTLQLLNEKNLPIYGAKVNLLENGYVVWSSLSDNTGKAELWRKAFTDKNRIREQVSMEIEFNGKFYTLNDPKQFSQGINFYKIETKCLKPASADIVFVVDATGSMGDEINYLKMDLQAIMKEIKDTLPNITFNLGSVFYRDTTDSYVSIYSDLNSDIEVTSQFIAANEAGGGGDFPEAVHSGLDDAINKISWNENSIAKIIFLVLDAPPHTNPEIINQLQALTLKASEKGIRIVPVSCSGIDKSTEYLLRSLALLTNGTYTFLTDDSGIGNPHIKPSTDKYEVETLKQILIRLVYQYSYYPKCENDDVVLTNDTLNVKFPEKSGEVTSEEELAFTGFKYYPNPTYGDLNIELSGVAEELFVTDISGKVIYRIVPNGQSRLFLNLAEYPSGMYFVMYQYEPDKWLKGKLVLMH